jgi:selenocysteine lyase/cysteine desulfurase
MSHASNVCGLIAPIEDICDLSKKYNSINIIDMAQTAGLVETDLMRIKADYAVFAGHKTLYAPFGVAGFIIDRNSQLQPLLFGGTGIDSANQELPDTIPEKFEVGSLNIQAIAGLNAALKWINKIGVDTIRKKEIENKRKLVECLKKFSNISIIGLNDGVGIVSCLFDGYSTDSIGLILSDNDIAVRTGLHCSPTAHKFLGTYPSGTVRFSVSYFNRNDDFNRLFEVLEIIDNGG